MQTRELHNKHMYINNSESVSPFKYVLLKCEPHSQASDQDPRAFVRYSSSRLRVLFLTGQSV